MFHSLTTPVRFSKALVAYASIRRVEERPPAPPGVAVLFHTCLILVPLISIVFLPFTWRALGAFMFMNMIGIIGSEVADHRYFSHRSFKTSKWFEGFLGLCSGLVLQDSAFHWATDHIYHHRYNDSTGEFRDHDPYNSEKGFWFSFYGWTLQPSPHRDDLEAKRKRGQGCYENQILNFVQSVPFIVACLFAIMIGLYLFGGVSAVSYGLIGLVLLPLLDMGLGNSIAHGLGPSFLHRRSYATADHSTNVAILAFAGSGVGWHNNHHAYPTSARVSFKWWQLDKAWLLIRAAEHLGLVWDVKVPTQLQQDRWRVRNQRANPAKLSPEIERESS